MAPRVPYLPVSGFRGINDILGPTARSHSSPGFQAGLHLSIALQQDPGSMEDAIRQALRLGLEPEHLATMAVLLNREVLARHLGAHYSLDWKNLSIAQPSWEGEFAVSDEEEEDYDDEEDYEDDDDELEEETLTEVPGVTPPVTAGKTGNEDAGKGKAPRVSLLRLICLDDNIDATRLLLKLGVSPTAEMPVLDAVPDGTSYGAAWKSALVVEGEVTHSWLCEALSCGSREITELLWEKTAKSRTQDQLDRLLLATLCQQKFTNERLAKEEENNPWEAQWFVRLMEAGANPERVWSVCHADQSPFILSSDLEELLPLSHPLRACFEAHREKKHTLRDEDKRVPVGEVLATTPLHLAVSSWDRGWRGSRIPAFGLALGHPALSTLGEDSLGRGPLTCLLLAGSRVTPALLEQLAPQENTWPPASVLLRAALPALKDSLSRDEKWNEFKETLALLDSVGKGTLAWPMAVRLFQAHMPKTPGQPKPAWPNENKADVDARVREVVLNQVTPDGRPLLESNLLQWEALTEAEVLRRRALNDTTAYYRDPEISVINEKRRIMWATLPPEPVVLASIPPRLRL
jgi:hypothetical protein